jgi:hypothetical protein
VITKAFKAQIEAFKASKLLTLTMKCQKLILYFSSIFNQNSKAPHSKASQKAPSRLHHPLSTNTPPLPTILKCFSDFLFKYPLKLDEKFQMNTTNEGSEQNQNF